MFKRHTTGIHYTGSSVEWAVLRKSRSEAEKVAEGDLPAPTGCFEDTNAPHFPAEVLAPIRKSFKGIVTVSLPSSHLLMRVLELPSTDQAELDSMVELQVDQFSPFPLDQLTISYEILDQNESHSRVLAVAAQRKIVDQLGDLFKKQHIHIQSLDSEILSWWKLLQPKVPTEGRVILLLEEHTEFSLVVVDQGIPICFRSLELFRDVSDESTQQEIIDEIRYALLTLETSYGNNAQCQGEFWSETDIPSAFVKKLESICSRGVNLHDLKTISPLAEGLAQRSMDRTHHHAELIPKEWTDLQRRRQALKIISITSIAILSIWLAVISVTGIVFTIRRSAFNRLQKEATIYEAPAREAKLAREEKISLEKFADRSHSALECLLEATTTLPSSVEINSFDYTKGKAVRLRGTCQTTDPIHSYFDKLGKSTVFSGIKNDRVGIQVRHGERIEAFSVTALLPQTATEDQP